MNEARMAISSEEDLEAVSKRSYEKLKRTTSLLFKRNAKLKKKMTDSRKNTSQH